MNLLFASIHPTILKLIGIPSAAIPDDAKTSFTFSPRVPQSWGVFVLAALIALGVYLVFFMYRREMKSCPTKVRIVLATLRISVLLLLVVVFLGPLVSYTQNHKTDPFIIILQDNSPSMATRDRYTDIDSVKPIVEATGLSPEVIRQKKISRIELVNQMVSKNDYQWVRKIAEKGRIRVIHFNESAEKKADKPRNVSSENIIAEAKSKSNDSIVWIQCRYLFIGSTILLVALVGLSITRQSALLLLFAAIPLTCALGSLTLLFEQNPGIPASQLFGFQEYQPPEETQKEKDAREELEKKKNYDATMPEIVVNGQASNYGVAIRKALEAKAIAPIAAIIIIGDAQSNIGGTDYVDAAIEAEEQRARIIAIGVGDPSEIRQLRITKVDAEEHVYRGDDPIEIGVSLEAKKLNGKSYTVNLYRRAIDEEGEGKLLKSKLVKITNGKASTSFEYIPSTKGKYRFFARIDKNQLDEDIQGNFEDYADVIVQSDKTKVLLIAGTPSHEYQVLHPLLRRDPSITLSCWLQSMDDTMLQEGNKVLRQIPRTKEDFKKYDAIILIDPNPLDLTQQWIGTEEGGGLKGFVEEGGGLLYVAGPNFSHKFLVNDYKTNEIQKFLPVILETTQIVGLESGRSKRYTKDFSMQVVSSNLDHNVMRFSTNEGDTKKDWDRLPGVYWTFPAVRGKKAARILLEHSDPSMISTNNDYRPLLVVGQYGIGKTAYMGFSSTWRWRRIGKDSELFTKYWIQMVRYLVEGRIAGDQQRGRIRLLSDKLNQGSDIKIKAVLKDVTGKPLTDPQVTMILTADKASAERTFILKPVQGKVGEYEGIVKVLALGTNYLTIELPGVGDNGSSKIVRSFKVKESTLETRDIKLNKKRLREIVKLSGNDEKKNYFDINEFDKVPDAIKRSDDIQVVDGKPVELWDNSRILFLFVLLLTIEWGTRKRYKLM